MQTNTTPTTGPELRRLREDLGAELQAVAAAMGVSRYTVWRLEKAPTVTRLRAADYVAAIRKLEPVA